MFEVYLISTVIVGTVLLAIWSTYYKTRRSKYGPYQNSKRVLDHQTLDSSVLAAFTCRYKDRGTAELYVQAKGVTCKRGEDIFFDVAAEDIAVLEYSNRNFFCLKAKGQNYRFSYVHLPEEGVSSSAYVVNDMAYIDKPATEKLTTTLAAIGIATARVPHHRVVFMSFAGQPEKAILVPCVILGILAVMITMM